MEKRKFTKRKIEITKPIVGRVFICLQPEQLQKSEASSRNLSSVSNEFVATKPNQTEKLFFFLQISTKKKIQKNVFQNFFFVFKNAGFLTFTLKSKTTKEQSC
jgi:hypothetical protein